MSIHNSPLGVSMSSVTFFYSSMAAGKSLMLLKSKYDYESVGKKVVCLTHILNNRDGTDVIKSRAMGVTVPAISIKNEDNVYDIISSINKEYSISLLLVDEAQFFNKKQIEQICNISDHLNIHVMCYGLRTDSNGDLFEGSATLLAWADKLIEVKNTCHCGKKATMTLRINKNNEVIKNAPQIQIGAEDYYVSVCRNHFNNNDIGK